MQSGGAVQGVRATAFVDVGSLRLMMGGWALEIASFLYSVVGQ